MGAVRGSAAGPRPCGAEWAPHTEPLPSREGRQWQVRRASARRTSRPHPRVAGLGPHDLTTGTCQAGGGITFRADFDSANLAHARQKPASSSDFELQTERDAANTEFATENRSWFYFGVHGHRAGAFLGFDDGVDRNKQAKLFNNMPQEGGDPGGHDAAVRNLLATLLAQNGAVFPGPPHPHPHPHLGPAAGSAGRLPPFTEFGSDLEAPE